MTTLGSNKAINLEAVRRFGKWLHAQHYASSTQTAYCRIAEKLCLHIGNIPLRQVTPMLIGDFLTNTLPSKWADSRILDQLAALRSFFDFLYFGGMVDSVAPRFLRARPREKRLPRTLTQAQAKKLLRTADNPRDKALVELLYATGCRTGEIAMLRVENIDFKRRTFRVRSKRKERVAYFGQQAAKAVRWYIGNRRSGYLFQDIVPQQRGNITHNADVWMGSWRDFSDKKTYGKRISKYLGPRRLPIAKVKAKFKKILKGVDLTRPKHDRALNTCTIGRIVQEIGRRGKLGNVTPKMLRHSFATHLLERGADIMAIQKLMGHSYLSSTEVYTHISNAQVAADYRTFHPRGGHRAPR